MQAKSGKIIMDDVDSSNNSREHILNNIGIECIGGYGYDEYGRPVELEQKGIELIHTLYEQGYSKAEILKIMNNGYINKSGDLIKIEYNQIGRRVLRVNVEDKLGLWPIEVIEEIIDKYIKKNKNVTRKYMSENKEEIRKICQNLIAEDQHIPRKEIVKRINGMFIFDLEIKQRNINTIIDELKGTQKPTIFGYTDIMSYKVNRIIMRLKENGSTKTFTIARKLNNLNIKPPGKGNEWFRNTVESFLKKCEEIDFSEFEDVDENIEELLKEKATFDENMINNLQIKGKPKFRSRYS